MRGPSSPDWTDVRSYPLVVFLVAFLLVAVGLARDAFMIWGAPHADPSCRGGTALVMGAAQYDGRPSPALARRLDRALELYRAGCVERIVVSGGARGGDRFSEGEAGIRYLVARDVPSSALAAETSATTSLENLLNSRALVGEGHLVVVTDDLHAHRTHWLAARVGLDADVATVPVPTGRADYGLRELVILFIYPLGFGR